MFRAAMLGVAHVHAPGYARCLRESSKAELAWVYDRDPERARQATADWGGRAAESVEQALSESEMAIVASENLFHGELIEACVAAGKPVLCEKPLAASWAEHDQISALASRPGALVATAFPCPHSPVFKSLYAKVAAGELGRIVAVAATNRGRCPGGWFIDPSLSGGGAMIDHTVHVADLLWRLLGEEPVSVTAAVGNNLLGLPCEDTAHLTLRYASGVFASIDSSWSRPSNYETWGDVTLRVVGEDGVAEADLFGQGMRVWTDQVRVRGTGSDLDSTMVEDFLAAVGEGRAPMARAEDGLRASRVALNAYQSLSLA